MSKLIVERSCWLILKRFSLQHLLKFLERKLMRFESETTDPSTTNSKHCKTCNIISHTKTHTHIWTCIHSRARVDNKASYASRHNRPSGRADTTYDLQPGTSSSVSTVNSYCSYFSHMFMILSTQASFEALDQGSK